VYAFQLLLPHEKTEQMPRGVGILWKIFNSAVAVILVCTLGGLLCIAVSASVQTRFAHYANPFHRVCIVVHFAYAV
jgi:hypothetical protein